MENKYKKFYLIPHETNKRLYVFTNNLPKNRINSNLIFNLEKPNNFLKKFNIKYKYSNNQNWKSLKNLYISKNENKELLHKIVSIGSFKIPLKEFVKIVYNRTSTSVVRVNSSNNQLKHKVLKPTLTKPQQETERRFKINEEKSKKEKSMSHNNFGNYMANRNIKRKKVK
jgi:hypothetical protein